jgi:hypothetical protein
LITILFRPVGQAIFIACLVLFGSVAYCEDAIPSQEDIDSWWGNSKETITIREDAGITLVYLQDRQQAYLAGVSIDPRGRNFQFNTILIQPSMQKVTELGAPFGQRFEIMDLDQDGVSEIVTDASGSGQGTIFGEQAIVQLDGDVPVVLRKMEYSNNGGYAGIDSDRYFSASVTWEFIDLDDDGSLDLHETRRSEEGREGGDPVVTEESYRYLFKNSEFIEYN